MTGDDLASWLRAVGVCLALAQPACAAAPRAGAESPQVSIGVAAIESLGGVSAADLDLGARLAERIVARGVQTVVGPAQLGGVVDAEPAPAQVQAWAAAAGVATIAVGRATRIGERQLIDVRLRAGSSGGLVGSYFAEAATAEALAPALDQLAGEIVDGTVEWLTGDVSAAPGAPAAEPKARGGALRSKGHPFGMTGLDNDQPISIHSDELEASQNAGARRLVFKQNVRVEQGDLQLASSRLEAFYPANASQPDRLVASGGVHVVQGTREARCDEAVYHRRDDLLVCEGHAELIDGDDRVAGDVIEFDLAAERVLVKGGASVLFHPEEKPPAVEPPQAPAAVAVPVEPALPAEPSVPAEPVRVAP